MSAGKRRKTCGTILPFLFKPSKNMSYPGDFVPKVFEPTPFRAAALNSFFEVAESAKEKEKIYYSHLGIEVRKDQLKDSSVSNAQYG